MAHKIVTWLYSVIEKFFDAFAISHITLCFRGSISVVILKPFAHEKYHNTKFPGQNADQKLRPEEITCQPVSTWTQNFLRSYKQSGHFACQCFPWGRPASLKSAWCNLGSVLYGSSELPSSMVNCWGMVGWGKVMVEPDNPDICPWWTRQICFLGQRSTCFMVSINLSSPKSPPPPLL